MIDAGVVETTMTSIKQERIRRVSIGRIVLGAYVVLAALFLATPVVVVILVSLDTASYVRFPPSGVTLRWYWQVITSETMVLAMQNSIIVGVACTALALLLGVPAAVVVARRRFWGRDAVYALLLSPLTVPWIVVGLSLLFLWAALGRNLSLYTLIVGHTVVGLPYVVRTCTAVLAGIPPSYEAAARTLGAGRSQAFRLVTLPMMRMGIIAGAVFSFLISFINVPVSLFATTSTNVTIPVAIFSQMLSNFDPGVAAISTLQLLIILAILYVSQRIARIGDFLI